MPASFTVADVSRIVTGKVQHTHFVCENMSVGSITCSAIQIDGHPSQINVAGLMHAVCGTISGTSGSFDLVTCNRISIASQASISSLAITGSLSAGFGSVTNLITTNLTSLYSNSQIVAAQTLTSQTLQSVSISASSLLITGSASSASLSSTVINSAVGNFATVTATAAQVANIVATGTVTTAALAISNILTAATVSAASLALSGSASVAGILSAQALNGPSCNIATLTGSIGVFSKSLSTGTFSSAFATVGSLTVNALVSGSSASITNGISAASVVSASIQSNSISATMLSAGLLNVNSITASALVVSSLSAGVVSTSNINVAGPSFINFGSDQTKASKAGFIGYQLTTTGALDIYGAGTVIGSRNVQFWDNVGLLGTLTTANISLSGKITSPSFTPSWTSVGSFLNNWSAYVGQTPPSYWKDPFGIVHLRGLMRNTAASSGVCFVLPTGYLPVNYAYFACSDSNADTSSITVCISSTASGTVSAGSVTIATSTVTVSLDGVTFATN